MLKQYIGLENASSLGKSIHSFYDALLTANEFFSFLDFLRFRLYGQQCKICEDGTFINPLWYEDEVKRVLENVHKKIGKVVLTLKRLLTLN